MTLREQAINTAKRAIGPWFVDKTHDSPCDGCEVDQSDASEAVVDAIIGWLRTVDIATRPADGKEPSDLRRMRLDYLADLLSVDKETP